ncbi:MAG TPA: 4'-phosphopantetheinyl transferase superfamily protein [Streptosporangiaceae bacterium]
MTPPARPGDAVTVPPGDRVDVWWFDTRVVAAGPAGLADLDQGERDRAEAFLFPADRHRYQVAHLMLRRVLAGYTGTPPGRLQLGREQCPHCGAPGKPVLEAGAGPAPSFSLTHSGDLVAIAVAGRPVGVDVERDAGRCVCSLAQALHPADAAWVAGLGEPDRHEAIITCWVRAEAVLKCTGQGIGHGLGGFPVRPGRAAGPGLNGCTVRQLPAPEGYRAAVALSGACPPVLRAPGGGPPMTGESGRQGPGWRGRRR